jgi:hypothetical protein
MNTLQLRRLWLGACLACMAVPALASPPDDPGLSKEEMKHFLLTAPVIHSKQSGKGVTHPWRLTLSDGKITHDASFQTVDEHKSEMKLESGFVEYNFVDSYKYNIAAYRIAELIGMDDLLPVYVERKWENKVGSLSWWLPVKMDEGERLRNHIAVPNPDDWNKQMYKIRVFDQLLDDTDPNLTNVLIDENFRIYRVDFTRAFRRFKDLRAPKDLERCDKELFSKLKALDRNQVVEQTKGLLVKPEIDALMSRRDKIVALFERRIKEKGEGQVLF